MNPRKFFDAFVAPAIGEARAEPLDIRKVTLALVELDNLLEHCLRHQDPTATRQQIGSERESVCGAHDFLAVARDVHDTHKHGALSRRSARISQGQRPETVSIGGGIGGGVGIGIGNVITYLMISTDDGQLYDVSSVIANCEQHLLTEIRALGL